MDVLRGKKCYLSGAIEFGEKENWRIEPTKVLTEEFGIDLFDPFEDPKQKWTEKIKEFKDKKDFKGVALIAKSFVRKDLASIDLSHFLIAYLPYKTITTGTHHEIINSNNAKKPTLLVTDMNDIGYLPTWYFGFIPIECMFAGFSALYEYLREVNDGKHKNNNRWSYVYGDI